MLIDVDKSRYDGKFVKGRKEGAGVLSYPSGAKYSGSWQRDKRHGPGRLDLAPNGEGEPARYTSLLFLFFKYVEPYLLYLLPRYVGDWADDMREGKGVMTDSSGVYDGDWKSDLVRSSFCCIFLLVSRYLRYLSLSRRGTVWVNSRLPTGMSTRDSGKTTRSMARAPSQ